MGIVSRFPFGKVCDVVTYKNVGHGLYPRDQGGVSTQERTNCSLRARLLLQKHRLSRKTLHRSHRTHERSGDPDCQYLTGAHTPPVALPGRYLIPSSARSAPGLAGGRSPPQCQQSRRAEGHRRTRANRHQSSKSSCASPKFRNCRWLRSLPALSVHTTR